MKNFVKEFKEFAVKGNVIDMAVGVIVGGAFSSIVSSLVADVFTPLISLLLGTVNFTDMTITVGEATIKYGNFIQNVINFLLTALCLFIFIKTINKFKKKEEPKEEETEEEKEPELSDEAKLLTEIKELLEKK